MSLMRIMNQVILCLKMTGVMNMFQRDFKTNQNATQSI